MEKSMFTVGTKVQVVRDMADGWGPSVGMICQVVKVHPDQHVFWITPLKADGTLGSGIFWADATDVKIIEEKKMTLGEKLKATLKAEEDAKREALRKEEEAKARARALQTAERQKIINCIKDEIITKIEDGKKPAYKLRGPTDVRAWINAWYLRSDGRPMEDREVWMGLQDWLKAEGLRLKITEGHDGMGMSDWLVISVKPIPGMEVEAD